MLEIVLFIIIKQCVPNSISSTNNIQLAMFNCNYDNVIHRVIHVVISIQSTIKDCQIAHLKILTAIT